MYLTRCRPSLTSYRRISANQRKSRLFPLLEIGGFLENNELRRALVHYFQGVNGVSFEVLHGHERSDNARHGTHEDDGQECYDY